MGKVIFHSMPSHAMLENETCVLLDFDPHPTAPKLPGSLFLVYTSSWEFDFEAQNSQISYRFLTIITGKNCPLLISLKEFIEIEAWLLLSFFYVFLCFFYFQQVFRQNVSWLLSHRRKTLVLRGFILKPTERAQILLKNSTNDDMFLSSHIRVLE